jgi:hypothetical protein
MKRYILNKESLNRNSSQVPVAHACNPSYLGGRDQEDCSSKPAQANSLQDPISNPPQNRVEGVPQVVEHLPSKCEALSSDPTTAKKTS